MAVTSGSTLWSGLDGRFPGRTGEGARPRQAPRERQGLGVGVGGARRQGRGLQSWPPSAAHVSAERPRAGPSPALRTCVSAVWPGLLRARVLAVCSWAIGTLAHDSMGCGASVGVVGEEVFAGSRSRPRLYSDRDPRPLTSPHNPSSSPDPSSKVLLPDPQLRCSQGAGVHSTQ